MAKDFVPHEKAELWSVSKRRSWLLDIGSPDISANN